MKLALDAYWWCSGPPSGRQVVRETVTTWVENFPEDDILVAVRRGEEADVAEALPGTALLPLRLRPHALAVAVELPWRIRHSGRVLLTQNFAAAAGHSAVFLHDVLFKSNPEWFTRAERVYLSLIGTLLRRSTVVLTSSASEAQRIERFFPRSASVHAVGLAISRELLDAIPARPRAAKTGDFVLSVGRLNRRKNLERVIEAAARSMTISPARPLVIVGEENGLAVRFTPAVVAMIEAGAVVFAGRVSDGELRWLYQNARGLVYLSLDEGFGLPPVEAAKFGTPMLLSDIPVFREVNGLGPRYVDPMDVDAIARGIDAFPPRDPTTENTGSDTGSDSGTAVGDLSWVEVVRRLRDTLSVQSGGRA